ncbi:tetratricopeptide repeat protein [Pendulispora albinea]|uniref:Tetratricopeptide repeat protein n=1 Tax=Pendulispora albinea TaxID=2741071 RepID=A0ABZ2M876_9BACT
MTRTVGLWPTDGDREHFAKAYQGRSELSPSARSYLEALAPAMTFPPNFRLSGERFAALQKNDPINLEVVIALAQNWIRVDRVADALTLLEPLAQTSDAPGVVLQLLAVAYALIDNVDASRHTLRRCLVNFVGSSNCATFLARIELMEGQCAAAEQILRQEIETNPNDAEAYFQLANARESQGASIQEIASALNKGAELRDGAPGGQSALSAADFTLAVHEGRFNDALALSDKHESRLQSSNDAWEHYYAALHSTYVRVELGMPAEAREAVDRFVANRTEFFVNHHSYVGDNSTVLNGLAAQWQLISWTEWAAIRDTRLRRHISRDDLVHGRQRAWLELYAVPATTSVAAKEALAVLPEYAPILSRTQRWANEDAAVGRVYWLTGSPTMALPYFERASAACTRLDNPVQHTQMLTQYGALLEDIGQKERACEVYRRVLHYWPRVAESTTATRAASRAAAVCPRL